MATIGPRPFFFSLFFPPPPQVSFGCGAIVRFRPSIPDPGAGANGETHAAHLPAPPSAVGNHQKGTI